MSGGVAPFAISEVPTLQARRKQAVGPTMEDVRRCWKLVLDDALDGKPWALRFVLEKHPLAKKYAALESEMAGLTSGTLAELASVARDALPSPQEKEAS